MFEYSPLLQAFYKNSLKFPDKIAVICDGKQISYAELWQNILRTACFLSVSGLRQGDYIALSARKEVEFLYVYFASHCLGVVNVVVDAEANSTKLAYIMDLLKPKVVFGFQYLSICSLDYASLDLSVDHKWPAPVNLSQEGIADVLFTTGTTGLPKGVQLSHYNIFSAVCNINGFIGNTANDVEVLGLPLCHSFGLGRLRCVLVLGATIVLLGNFANLKLLFATIEKYKVTGLGMVPSMWAYIRKYSGTRIAQYTQQIHYIEIGSAPMSLEMKKELCLLFPNTRICMHYGLTEASRSAFMEFHQCPDNLATIGRPVADEVDIKIFDENGLEVEDNSEGELCIKGNMVMKRYYLEQDNQGAYWGEYFRTGDYGYKDEQGFFYLISRKKELINVGGKKVSPIEIEEAVCRLGIKDCICVGIPDVQSVLGEVPKVYILKEGCKLSFSEIQKALENQLENYMVPRQYEWIDEIPVTVSGKKQRLLLKI